MTPSTEPTGYDVLSFGETMLRLTPPATTRLEEARSFHSYVAGTESNTTAGLARLGLRCAWISGLPANPLGRLVAGELQRHGVDTRHVVWAEAGARLGTYYAEEAANPLGVQVYYDRAHSACAQIDPAAIPYDLIGAVRLLHLTGITPALSVQTRIVLERWLERAQAQGTPFSFDVNYRAKLWPPQAAAQGMEAACRAATILFCTRDDAAELWNLSGSGDEMLPRIAERFSRDNPDQTIVMTLGRDGAAQIQHGTISRAPAFPSDGISRFGSGDAFAAGYLYACLDGPGYARLRAEFDATPLICGNAAAALKRCIPGDIALITYDELLHVIRGQGGRFR